MANREEGGATPNWRQGQEQLQQQDAAGQRHLHITGQNFKPEFSGKPEEDVEAHLLHSNDWINAHCFDEDIKVQRFWSYIVRRSKIVVVSFLRTLKRHNMGTNTEYNQTKVLRVR